MFLKDEPALSELLIERPARPYWRMKVGATTDGEVAA